MPDLIAPATLKELVAANAIRSATVLGEEGGYVVAVRYGLAEQRVVSARNRKGHVHERLFRSLDAASRYLRELGLIRYDVDLSRHSDASRPIRRDRSEAMKKLHKAASHAKWLREQAAAAVAQADSDDAEWVDGDQVDAWLATWGQQDEKPAPR